MSDVKFVNVAGFFYSGSGAVVDLLKEFENFYECNAEIRFIKDPFGLSQLESALVEHWELINSAAAIADFREMCRKGSRPGGRKIFAKAGHGYSQRIAHDFMDIVDEYIDRLTEFTYKDEYYHFKFQKPYLKYVIDRIRHGIERQSGGKIKIANRNIKPLHFSHPTQEKFNSDTQWFMKKIFHEHIEGKESPCIILDQAVSPNNPQVIHRYFTDSKLIIVDRDPRDSFINIAKASCYTGKDLNSKETGHNYSIRQKALRSNLVTDPDIMYVRFEDLITKYEEVVRKIANFIGVPIERHTNPKKYLDPGVSINNIGLWKKYYNECKDTLDQIAKELPDLCYNMN